MIAVSSSMANLGSIIRSIIYPVTTGTTVDDHITEQVLAHCTQTLPTQFVQIIDISKYSSLQKLLAVTMYVL